ncbi:MAG TPA: hypothetical protein VLL07_05920 [Pontiella sp.]|nr:hypothetical protein [Pontiella sp.]
MKRVYKKKPLFDAKKAGQLVFILFIAFIAYRILTPPSDELARIDSPDGTQSARLVRYFYYDNQPSYKVYCREADKPIWLNIYHLPAYTNVPPEAAMPAIAWSSDSRRLDFLMNGTSIWHYVFDK